MRARRVAPGLVLVLSDNREDGVDRRTPEFGEVSRKGDL